MDVAGATGGFGARVGPQNDAQTLGGTLRTESEAEADADGDAGGEARARLSCCCSNCCCCFPIVGARLCSSCAFPLSPPPRNRYREGQQVGHRVSHAQNDHPNGYIIFFSLFWQEKRYVCVAWLLISRYRARTTQNRRLLPPFNGIADSAHDRSHRQVLLDSKSLR